MALCLQLIESQPNLGYKYYPATFRVYTHSMDCDQTVTIEAVCSGSTLSCLGACISQNIGKLGQRPTKTDAL